MNPGNNMPTIYKRLNWKEDLRYKIDPSLRGKIKKMYQRGNYTLKELADKYQEKYQISYWTIVNAVYGKRAGKAKKNPKNTELVRNLRARKRKIGKVIYVPAKKIREYKELGLTKADLIEDFDGITTKEEYDKEEAFIQGLSE